MFISRSALRSPPCAFSARDSRKFLMLSRLLLSNLGDYILLVSSKPEESQRYDQKYWPILM